MHRLSEFRNRWLVHPFLEVCLSQLIMRESKVGIHVDRLAALFYRLVVGMHKEKKLCQVGVDNERQWIQAFRLPHFDDRVVIPAYQRQMPGVPMVSGCVAGV